MSYYYPQGAMTLKVRWEDFGDKNNAVLNEVYEMLILARNIKVSINDYTQADTFSCEIDYKSFPFDPRTIRSAGVTIHIENRGSIFNVNALDLLKPSKENTVFTGFADEENISFDDESRIVRMEGRDFTSLFVDAKYLGPPVNLSKPIDKVIESLIAEQPATAKIEIDNRTGDTVLPTLTQLAPDFNSATSVKNPKRGETYWDIIQRIVARAGLIGFIELDKFVLSKPQALYNREKTKLFVWGKNVKELSFKRNLGRQKGFNVQVSSLNIEAKEVITAKIPEEATDPNIAGPAVTIPQLDKDGNKIEPPKTAPYLNFRVPDIASKDHLIKVGEKIYEELSRQQIEGSLKTYEMEIPENTGNTSDRYIETEAVSFNTIRNGTPIEIMLSPDDMKEVKTASTLAQKKKFLKARGYAPEIADAFAKSLNRIVTPFYTKAVTFIIDQNNGFEMNIDFINFIELDNKNLVS
jgi:hypothetical protein